MISELMAIHNEVMATTPHDFTRYLYGQINWDAQAICILGDRGVGKTTMICQYLIQQYGSADKALYLSADNIHVLNTGLFTTARRYFSTGGEALFIDEVHKYPDWSIEVKNILDTYKGKKVVLSGSSSIDLKKSKGDLSRRVVYHPLPGLSFREYLKLNCNFVCEAYSLDEILFQHVKIADQFKDLTILKEFNNYLKYGYYPIFNEGTEDYLGKINNVIEKVIYEDIAVVYKLKQHTLLVLKKILWLVATSEGLTPNIDKISKNIQVSREVVYECFQYLNQAGLTNNLFEDAKGLKLVRKPGKVFLNNTSLLHAINGSLKLGSDTGVTRETMFVNQVGAQHKINLHHKADFVIDSEIVVEVGGRGKSNSQLKGLPDGYLAIDGIEVGYKHKIPLYLFGLLY